MECFVAGLVVMVASAVGFWLWGLGVPDNIAQFVGLAVLAACAGALVKTAATPSVTSAATSRYPFTRNTIVLPDGRSVELPSHYQPVVTPTLPMKPEHQMLFSCNDLWVFAACMLGAGAGLAAAKKEF